MPQALQISQGGVPVRVLAESLDAATRRQLESVSRLPVVGPFVAAMPDAHTSASAPRSAP